MSGSAYQHAHGLRAWGVIIVCHRAWTSLKDV